MSKSTNNQRLSSLVLCGGAGRRLGGVDKPLQSWAGEPLVQHILRRLPVGLVLISANRSIADYRRFGYPVVEDSNQAIAQTGAEDLELQGPLAGILAAYEWLLKPTTSATAAWQQAHWLYVVPGDTPQLPQGLANELLKLCLASGVPAACVKAERLHPLPLLVKTSALPTLVDYFASNQRSVAGWLKHLSYVALENPGYEQQLLNINTPEQLAALNLSTPTSD